MNAFFNMCYDYFANYSYAPRNDDFFQNLVVGGIGFLALNVVAVICARFADILHSILKKG